MKTISIHILPWVLSALLLAASLFLFSKLLASKKEYQRVVASAGALNGELLQLKTNSGKLMAENQVLRLKTEELLTFMPSLKQDLAELKVKISRVQQSSSTTLAAYSQSQVTLRDSILFDTIPVKVFDYDDGYFSIHGQSDGQHQFIQAHYQDTLTQVVFKGERTRPWLWIFSPRKLTQRIALKNPNAKVIYSKTIQIER